MVETRRPRLRSRREERLFHLRAGVVPGDWQPPANLDAKYPHVAELNEKIGFWIESRRCAVPVALRGRPESASSRSYEWRCGCTAYAIDGRVMQYTPCVAHGGEEDDD